MFELGRADGIAVMGKVLGEILAGENPAEALVILQRSVEMYSKLGQEAKAREVEDLIKRLGQC
jgi:hypothetical protein